VVPVKSDRSASIEEDAVTAQAVSEPGYREVKSRRIKFSFNDTTKGGGSRYFVDDDIAMSHLVAILSAGFPGGEESFIRSVHHFQDEITDPVLKDQVKGFIGQEMTHGREHRNLNDTLAEMGYPTQEIDGLAENMQRLEKLVPPLIPLAATAAAEHFTAVLAARLLNNRAWVDHVAKDLEIRNVLNWHAFEELEHKAVAFDVFKAMGGSEPLRIATMLVMIPAGVGVSMLGMGLSMALDPGVRRRPLRAAWSVLNLPRNPLLRNLIPELAEYLRPGFHPDDTHTDGLLEESRERLFGSHGELVDHLK
jgi:hypothetical protein